jgi:hypothetical protein
MAVNEAGNHGKYEETDKVRQRLHDIFIKSPLTAGLTFQKEAPRGWAAWEKLKPAAIKAKLKELKAERNKLLDHKADLEVKGQELSESEKQRLEELGFDIDVGEFEPLLRDYEAQPWKALPDPKARLAKHAAKFADVLRGFAAILAPATKERQAQIRESWPPLFPAFVGEVDLLSADDDTALDTVVQTAFNNRLDLMNQRAQLVDSWRKLRVVANSLFGTFNVEYHLNSTTPPGRNAPFAFSENRTAHELIFNTQLPIVRRAERNNYRSALIAYQQQRRAWMDAQDQIAFAVRFQLRNLRSAAFNFQVVQRRNMELAYLVVDQALQAFNQPAAPTGGGGQVSPPGGAPSQGDAAALTQQLVQVQGTLVAAQNGLFNQWLGYIQNRISLYRDMGLMPLDERGLWIDDVTYYHPSGESGACLPGFLPTVVPEPGAHEPNAPLPPHEAPAQPVPPEQLPPPAQLLSPTILAPQQMP